MRKQKNKDDESSSVLNIQPMFTEFQNTDDLVRMNLNFGQGSERDDNSSLTKNDI